MLTWIQDNEREGGRERDRKRETEKTERGRERLTRNSFTNEPEKAQFCHKRFERRPISFVIGLVQTIPGKERE